MTDSQAKQYAPIFKYLNRIFNFIAGLIAIALFVVVIIQIIGRSIGYPSPWTEEMTRYIFIWMIFLGIGVGFQKAESPRVTVFLNIMPKFIRQIGSWIYTIGTIGFLLFMVVYGIELVQQQIAMNETSSVLLFPVWIVGISVDRKSV